MFYKPISHNDLFPYRICLRDSLFTLIYVEYFISSHTGLSLLITHITCLLCYPIQKGPV